MDEGVVVELRPEEELVRAVGAVVGPRVQSVLEHVAAQEVGAGEHGRAQVAREVGAALERVLDQVALQLGRGGQHLEKETRKGSLY